MDGVRKGRIGILGGTFNPIHLGHLMIAEMALEAYELDRVIFVPACQPPHKSMDVLDAKYRYEMTRVAVMDNPRFTISDVEMNREGPSYTIDTIKYFREIYGDDKEYFFIAGTDTIHELPTWKYIHELLDLCEFIGAVRPDGSQYIQEVIEGFGDLGKRIHLLEVPEMKLSATDLRHRLRTGKSVRYMLPKLVYQYIAHHRIYMKEDLP